MGYLNTGYKIVTRLRQVAVYADAHRDPTGVTKPNDPDDPDYIPPYLDEDACVPPVPCGTPVLYTGGIGFPNVVNVDLGADTGLVYIRFDTGANPDKLIVSQAGVVLLDTGYCGDPSNQAALDANLISRGLPTETINDTSPSYAQNYTFTKSIPLPFIKLEIYSPLTGTNWAITTYCPGVVPATTTTTTTSTTTTTTIAP